MRKFYFILICFFYFAFLNAQNLLTLAEYRSNNNPTSGQSGVAVSGNVIATGLLRGPGLTFGGAGNFGAKSWATTYTYNSSDYFQFTIGAQAGFKLNLKYIEFNFVRDINGPSAIEIRTSLNNYATTIYTDQAISTANNSTAFSLNYNNITSPITFRVYGYRAKNSNGLLSLVAIPSYVEKLLTGGAQAGIVIKGTKAAAVNTGPYTNSIKPDVDKITLTNVESNINVDNIMSIYPNPVSSTATVTINSITENKLVLKIINPLGQIVHSQILEPAQNSEYIIDFTKFERHGLYYIFIDDGVKTLASKVMCN